jgi:hypothetical protein
LAEVAIKGESMIESVMINQRKAGAIDEAKVFVIISSENRLCCLFNRSLTRRILMPVWAKDFMKSIVVE